MADERARRGLHADVGWITQGMGVATHRAFAPKQTSGGNALGNSVNESSAVSHQSEVEPKVLTTDT
jgi:hypothetical protein